VLWVFLVQCQKELKKFAPSPFGEPFDFFDLSSRAALIGGNQLARSLSDFFLLSTDLFLCVERVARALSSHPFSILRILSPLSSPSNPMFTTGILSKSQKSTSEVTRRHLRFHTNN
jgi:hypothetical protein